MSQLNASNAHSKSQIPPSGSAIFLGLKSSNEWILYIW